ncbi:tannase and feruloyl esterase [Hypomontagnella submonticulosa]|nr:tannase and feruloyl esterase [Hypomontagnella submonticulosa]
MTSLLPIQACVPSTFSHLSLLGAEILSIDANPVSDYDFDIPVGWRYSQPAVNVQNATFCNVTVTYTHTGLDDNINIEVWLPEDNWNGRLQSLGGGGWVAGRFALTYGGMAGAIHDGYATATTDAGLGNDFSPVTWGLISPGNLNLVALNNFGQVSLGDEASIAKQVIESYYGKPPSYSYWNGCSGGGRQAGILAQQYPTAYDGIIAAAPALYWAEIMMSSTWPAFYMDLTKQYPRECELAQLTALAIGACDGLDGVEDGLIAEPEECRKIFNPPEYIGTTFRCSDTGLNTTISAAAVSVAEAIWDGPRFSNGDFLWYGYEIGSNLSALAAMTCAENGTCIPNGLMDLAFNYQYFVLKDPSANVTTLTYQQFDSMYRTLKKVFSSSVAATEPGIFDFQSSGGKMITYHGLADDAITPGSSLHYYEEVEKTVGSANDFYRYYRVPGLAHCWGGSGGQPEALFDQLRSWVENGTAPEASPVKIHLTANITKDEIICPYPKRAVFQQACTGSSVLECWSCVSK